MAKAKQKPCRALYSWERDKQASKECIRYFIRRAMADKIWALTVPDGWAQRASEASREMQREYATLSIHTLARGQLNYCRYRAGLGGWDDWPWDRPARILWNKLNRQEGVKC